MVAMDLCVDGALGGVFDDVVGVLTGFSGLFWGFTQCFCCRVAVWMFGWCGFICFRCLRWKKRALFGILSIYKITGNNLDYSSTNKFL